MALSDTGSELWPPLLRTSRRKLITYFSLTCTSLAAFCHSIKSPQPPSFRQKSASIRSRLIFDQPLDAIEGPAAFFVGGKGDDDVAVGLKAFALVADQVGDPDRGLRFVVQSAAAVEVTIALDELKRIHAPVFALGFDDISVGEQQDAVCCAPLRDSARQGSTFSGWRRPGKISESGKPAAFKTRGHSLGCGRCRAGRVARLDLDQLLEDRASELLIGERRHQSAVEAEPSAQEG